MMESQSSTLQISEKGREFVTVTDLAQKPEGFSSIIEIGSPNSNAGELRYHSHSWILSVAPEEPGRLDGKMAVVSYAKKTNKLTRKRARSMVHLNSGSARLIDQYTATI